MNAMAFQIGGLRYPSHPAFVPNPRRAWWIAGGIVAVVGGGAWWWWSHRRQYVGTGWKWPRSDVFPDEMSFGHSLNTLGYGAAVGMPGWEPTSKETMATVLQFQQDYNTVFEAAKRLGLQIGPKPLVLDGLIGKDTVNALVYAVNNNNLKGPWIETVSDARAVLLEVPPIPSAA